MIEASGDAPSYTAWLIGGDPKEAAELLRELRADTTLDLMWRSGRLVLWSRVAYETLPEFYSRATIVAMPSRRETFGLVAIEAMACGAPVIAGSVGGLKDTVLPMLTGAHIEPGDSVGLAMTIAAWLKNPPLCKYLGDTAHSWSRTAFGHSSPQSGLQRILQRSEGENTSPHLLEKITSFGLNEVRHEVEEWLGPLDACTPWTLGLNRMVCVETKGQSWVVKKLGDCPNPDVSIYEIPDELHHPGAAHRLARSVLAGRREGGLSVHGHKGSLLKMPLAHIPADQGEAPYIATMHRFARSDSVEAPEALKSALDALQAEQTKAALAVADIALAKWNEHLTGSDPVFVRCHPSVELIRLIGLLSSQAFIGPTDTARSLVGLATALLRTSRRFSDLPAQIQHGDVQIEHFLELDGELLLSDGEWLCRAFGPLDLASYCIRKYLWEGDVSVPAAAEFVREHTAAELRSDLLTWIFVQYIHLALVETVWGTTRFLRKADGVLDELVSLSK